VKRRKRGSRRPAKRVELNMKDLFEIVELSRERLLNAEQQEKLRLALRTLSKLAGLDDGFLNSEKSRDILDTKDGAEDSEKSPHEERPEDDEPSSSQSKDGKDGKDDEKKPQRPGHGRMSADAYTDADTVDLPHPSLKPGDPCPECPDGKVYEKQPSIMVRLTGQPPVQATRYRRQRLRCNLCGVVFTAPVPAGLGGHKYDPSAAAIMGLLRYGSGLPFHRLACLQGHLGTPLPTSTQWDIAQGSAAKLEPAFDQLLEHAAEGEVLHNDDTSMRVLGLGDPELREKAGCPPDRTGTFTSGIVSIGGDRKIALFLTGWKHAGENLAAVLSRRRDEGPPIQMCDGLGHNIPKDFATILSNCLAHGRRNFVKTLEAFPEESQVVILALRDVYWIDALAKECELTARERLRLHQEESAPIMGALEQWLHTQLEGKHVEPNSAMGSAIRYMRKRWAELTLFLRIPGAPLDNNTCNAARGITRIMSTRGLCRVDPSQYPLTVGPSRILDGLGVGIVKGSPGRRAGDRVRSTFRVRRQRKWRARAPVP